MGLILARTLRGLALFLWESFPGPRTLATGPMTLAPGYWSLAPMFPDPKTLVPKKKLAQTKKYDKIKTQRLEL